jgi:hypothetical protein
VVDVQKEAPVYDREPKFHQAPIVKTNFFALTFLTRITEHGIMYSPKVNCRSVNPEYLLDNSKDKSLVDRALASGDNCFSSSPFHVLFYQEKSLGEIDLTGQSKAAKSPMQSLTKETLKIGSLKIKDVTVKTNKIGVFPSSDQLLRLAFILGVKVAVPPDVNTKDLDYPAILNFFHQATQPRSVKELKLFLHKDLKWTFFDLHKGPLYINLWRVRSFFQTITKIGIAFIEGQHRAVLAAKLLYGQPVNIHYPLDFFDNIGSTNNTVRWNTQFHIPKNSPLNANNLEVKIIIPQSIGRAPPKRVISSYMLQACEERSLEVTMSKTLYIEETWKTFIQNTVQSFIEDVHFSPISIEEFLQIQLPTRMKEGWTLGTGDMFRRDTIPFVNTCHYTIEKLVRAFYTYQPARQMLTKLEIRQEDLMQAMNKSNRIGFGPVNFMHKGSPNSNGQILTEKYFKDNNPFRQIWNDLAPMVLPELFLRTIPFEGGLNVLSEFAKNDMQYVDLLFIAFFVIAPVTDIVTTIMEIANEQNIFTSTLVDQNFTSTLVHNEIPGSHFQI